MLFPWEQSTNIQAELSTKVDGPMPTSNRLGDSPWDGNRQRWLKSRGINPDHLVSAVLCHGTEIRRVSEQERGQRLRGVDGLYTNVPGVYLAVTVADCLPIYVVDPEHQAVGIVHAGWRGVLSGIVTKMVHQMTKSFATDACQVRIGIGPSIHVCHYEVGEDVAKQFGEYRQCIHRETKKPRIDLVGIVQQQLDEVGVEPNQITIDPRCTFEEPSLYSFRRDHDLAAGVMTAIIGLRT